MEWPCQRGAAPYGHDAEPSHRGSASRSDGPLSVTARHALEAIGRIATEDAVIPSHHRSDTAAIAVVILLIGVFGVSQGLCYPLFSLILEHQGVDSTLIGLSSAAMPIGLIAFSPFLPATTKRFGSVGVALACAVSVAVLLGLMGLVQNVWFWFPARFLLGFGIGGLFVTSETWINVMGPPQWRGRLLGLYSSSMALGFAVGPFILIAAGSRGLPPFAAGVAVIGLTAALLYGVRRRLPDVGQEKTGSLKSFLPLAPALLCIVGIVAAFDQALLSLFPVYGATKDLAEQEIAVAITVWAAGNILFQLPIGWLADRWSRRGTMMLLCATTILGALALPFAVRSPWLLWPLLFLWGPSSYGIYTLSIIELGFRFRGTMLLAGNASFAVMWGLGGMIGPPSLGIAMDRFGAEGLPVGLGLLYLGLLGLVLVRRDR